LKNFRGKKQRRATESGGGGVTDHLSKPKIGNLQDPLLITFGPENIFGFDIPMDDFL
jgi:hypothetical protein